jgi:hypothetical protein
MSLQRLLSDFPNYSARKVRRLAKQLALLEKLDHPEAKGIASDLMEFNLQSAQLEERLAELPVAEASKLDTYKDQA